MGDPSVRHHLVRQALERFREEASRLSGPAFAKDRDGCYLWINDAGARLLERRPKQVVGRRDDELFPSHIEHVRRTPWRGRWSCSTPTSRSVTRGW